MDTTLERILELMKEKRVTAYAMKDVLGVPHGSFSNWKRGKGKSFYEHIDMIADQLGVTIEYLGYSSFLVCEFYIRMGLHGASDGMICQPCSRQYPNCGLGWLPVRLSYRPPHVNPHMNSPL